jgi:hypothetical protein
MNRGWRASREGEAWSRPGNTPQEPPVSLNVEQNVHGSAEPDDPAPPDAAEVPGDEVEALLTEEGMYRWRPMSSRSFSPMLFAAANCATVRPLAREIAHRVSPGCTT